MDKKTKKRMAVLKKKKENLRTQVATVRKFTDDPAELVQLEADLAKVEQELANLLEQTGRRRA